MACMQIKTSTTIESLEQYKRTINVAIENFLGTMPGALGLSLSGETVSVHAVMALEKLREYTMRPGKRIRGSLAAAAYDNARGTHLADAGIALGVAHELVQSYLLIVDDVT